MKFGSLLNKAKELVADKGKLSAAVDHATDVLDKQTGHKFSAELEKLDGMVGNLKPSDLDQLDGMVQKLDSLDEADIEKLKAIVGQLSESKTDTLSEADMEKLTAIAGKLGLTEPPSR